MHGSALSAGLAFAQNYTKEGDVVVDIGGRNVNGSLREYFAGKKFICVDMEAHPSVDIVVPPGDPFPFEDGSVDAIVSTSCFEHDPCFWLTFREMCRVVKVGGLIYVNAPSAGFYHGFPGDNWRFFSDAGQALAIWSTRQFATETFFPARVLESCHIDNMDVWKDYVCIWQRIPMESAHEIVSEGIVTPPSRRTFFGPLRSALHKQAIHTIG